MKNERHGERESERERERERAAVAGECSGVNCRGWGAINEEFKS